MKIVVALGANLGDRRAAIEAAIERLIALPDVVAHRRSHLYETDPVGGPPQPPFLNAALALELARDVDPREMVELLLGIERDLGRVRGDERNAPRTLDLDLLWTSGAPCDDPAATVPHPRLHERAFALAPLVDVAPEARDRNGVPYSEWLARTDRGGVRRLPSG